MKPGFTPIKVLIVDDSVTVQLNIRHMLEAEPGFQVVGMVRNGIEAVHAVATHHPDVVTMDIQMPQMDGIEATRQIMSTQPVPIVIVSSHSQDAQLTFRALEAGALTILDKPPGPTQPGRENAAEEMRRTLRQMSRVKVVRRWWTPTSGAAPLSAAVSPVSTSATVAGRHTAHHKLAVVGIGASTGGPPALLQVLKPLPTTFPAPILIVQHIAVGFMEGLRLWMQQELPHPVCMAVGGDKALPGHIYLAPEQRHLGINPDGRLVVSPDPEIGGHRPAVAYLFRSLASNFGPRAAGVLLTGMGRDGAEELALMRSRGSATVAQDHESSAVHGMPGEAIRLKAAIYIQNPPRIAGTLLHLAQHGVGL